MHACGCTYLTVDTSLQIIGSEWSKPLSLLLGYHGEDLNGQRFPDCLMWGERDRNLDERTQECLAEHKAADFANAVVAAMKVTADALCRLLCMPLTTCMCLWRVECFGGRQKR